MSSDSEEDEIFSPTKRDDDENGDNNSASDGDEVHHDVSATARDDSDDEEEVVVKKKKLKSPQKKKSKEKRKKKSSDKKSKKKKSDKSKRDSDDGSSDGASSSSSDAEGDDDIVRTSEEEDDEEEERRRKKRSKYLDIEAESGDDEDDGDSDFEGGGGGKKKKKKARVDEFDISHIPARRRHESALLNIESEEQLEEHLQQLHGGGDLDDFMDTGETGEANDLLVPSVHDPKLFMVKCKIGKEQDLVLRVLQKCYEFDQKGTPLSIFSAFTNGHSKGCFYVEAFRDVHVKECVAGLRDVYQKEGCKLVPIDEMQLTLTTSKTKEGVKEGDWVRVKGNVAKGLYKGDLGKVLRVDYAKDLVTIRLLPRLDFTKRSDSSNANDSADGGASATGAVSGGDGVRPPARLLIVENLPVDIQNLFESNADNEFFYDGNKIVHGYIEREMKTRSVDYKNIVPTLDEIRRFDATLLEKKEARDEEAEEEEHDIKTTKRPPVVYSQNDSVRVMKGDLINFTGVVDSVDKNTVRLRFKDVEGIFDFTTDEICKTFPQGQNVKVLQGRHKNKVGMVLRQDGEIVHILTLENKELRVLSRDLQLSTDSVPVVETVGIYQLYDLVQLDSAAMATTTARPTDVGIIVKIEGGMLDIMDNNGDVQKINPCNVKKRLQSQGSIALDSHSEQITVDHMVKVMDGLYKGKTGTVKHIYRSYLFLHSVSQLDDAGIFVCRPRQCVRVGMERPRGMGSQPVVAANVRHEKHPWVGKLVRIIEGMYKGQTGTVREAQEFMATVELTINRKRIPLRLAQLKEGEKKLDTFAAGLSDSFGFRSSSDAPPTPMHDADGSRTPLRDDSVWNPMTQIQPPIRTSASSSPADSYLYSSDFYTSATPHQMDLNPTTPMLNPNTPGSASGFSSATPISEQAYTPGVSFTPGVPYTPGVPFTPGGTNAYTPYGNLVPVTPGQGLAPTPYNLPTADPSATPNSPLTPGGSDISSYSGSSLIVESVAAIVGEQYCVRGVEVVIGTQGETGVVIERVGQHNAKVQVGSGEQIVALSTLQPANLSKNDLVIILIEGPMKGLTGRLIGIDGNDGILKMDGDADVKILDMQKLAKYRKL